MVTWVPEDPNLKLHSLVELKKSPGDWWRVNWISEAVIDQEDINRHWHVGGL